MTSGQGCPPSTSDKKLVFDCSKDHSYATVDSPRNLKRKMDENIDHLVDYQRKLSMEKQRTRRLRQKLSNLDTVVNSLYEKNLISTNVASFLHKCLNPYWMEAKGERFLELQKLKWEETKHILKKKEGTIEGEGGTSTTPTEKKKRKKGKLKELKDSKGEETQGRIVKNKEGGIEVVKRASRKEKERKKGKKSKKKEKKERKKEKCKKMEMKSKEKEMKSKEKERRRKKEGIIEGEGGASRKKEKKSKKKEIKSKEKEMKSKEKERKDNNEDFHGEQSIDISDMVWLLDSLGDFSGSQENL